ncbi:MAG: hypothetical protein ACOC1L_08135 [Bacillota bacterium]
MKKLYIFIKNTALINLIINVIVLFIALRIRRRLGIDIGYISILRSTIIISVFINIAIDVFKMDHIPTVFRVLLGYVILFMTTLIIRSTFGPYLFRRSLALLIFIFICTIIYFLALLSLHLRNKNEETSLNKALSNLDDEDTNQK